MEKTLKWRDSAAETLRNAPDGTTIFVIIRHVSSSGMLRILDPFVIIDGEPRYLRSLASEPGFPFKRDKTRDGFRVSGCGMDMTFHLVHSIAQWVDPDADPYRFRNRVV